MLSSRVATALLRDGVVVLLRKGGGGGSSTIVARALSSSSVPTASVPETTIPPHHRAHPDLDDSEKNSVQVRVAEMREEDPSMVFLTTMPADPVLPENPEEVAALDTALDKDGAAQSDWAGKRTVVIRQEQKGVSQSPNTKEKHWTISFQDDGAIAETWSNPLMGWVSGADAMGSAISMQLKFDNAKEAVYFAKKRGWKYEVERPILRIMRTDNAAYQDNFLPQDVAFKVRKDNTKCDHWHRSAAGTSHYFRPLKYHGDGLVDQHGPNGDAPVAPDAESYFKTR